MQNSATGLFTAQGNDIPGTLQFVLQSGGTVDIPGAINWRGPSGNSIEYFGFLPAATYAGQTITIPGGGSYTFSATSNFGIFINSSTLTYADGVNVQGNAANTGILDALNAYLLSQKVNGGAIGSNQTICSGVAPAALNTSTAASGGLGSYNYQWQSSSDNVTFTNISGATSETYTSGSLTATTYFRRIASDGILEGISNVVTITITGAPIVSVSPSSSTIAPGGNVSLTASGASTYAWSPSTGLSAATGATVTANPSATTTYTVTGTSAAGCTATQTVTVTVTANLTGGTVGSNQTICAGATPTALASSALPSGGLGSYTYQWESSADNSTFNVISGAQTTTYAPATLATTTYYRRKATDGTSTAYSNVVTITVNASPVTPTISAGGPTSFCAGGNVVLFSSSAVGNQWYKDGSIITDATSQTYTATASGDFTVIITSSGCSSEASAASTVTVNAIPSTPTISDGGALTTFCQGGSVVLTSSAATGNQWYKDGAIITGQTGQTYTANATGSYTVIATSTAGCASAVSGGTSVTVNPIPAAPTVTAGGPATFCAGGSVVLSSSAATGNQWYKDGAIITGQTGQTYTANATGSYTAIATSTAGCASAASSGTSVTVNPIPAAPTVTAGGPATFCAGGSVVLTSSAATGNQWYKDGAIITGQTGQTYTANATGSYTVIATSTAGCASGASAATVVTSNPIPAAPSAITGRTLVIRGSSQTYSVTAVSGATSYNWTLPTGWSGTSTTNSINVTAGTANGNITVTAAANGCISPAASLAVVTDTDNDGDGVPDSIDLDDDNDGILDTVEGAACSPADQNCDTDGDGTPNRFDLESDGDGIPDVVESNGTDANADGRADGAVSATGIPASAGTGNLPPDTDADGKRDPYDVDSDADGITDTIEKGPDGNKPIDTDKDSVQDYRDVDSDNDGIPDADEAGPDPSKPIDSDGDGIPDYREIDSNNDSVPDNETLLIFKTAGKPVLATDGSFTYTYTITIRNARKETLNSVQVKEDLTKTFVSPMNFSVTAVKLSAGLTAAAGFDGRSQINLLGSGVSLPGFAKETIEITVKVLPNGFSGNVNNTAEGSAVAKWFNVTRQSIDTSASAGRKHGAGLATVTAIPNVEIKIADVITPNNDGYNDKWIILRPSNVKVGVTVFNKWGQVVYKTSDYKNDWSGTSTNGFLGNQLPSGTYLFIVELSGGVFTSKDVRKGSLTLKRDN